MRTILLFALVCSVASCHYQEDSKTTVEKTTADTIFAAFAPNVQLFSLSSPKALPDSNELYLYFQQMFDTSFLVHFKKTPGEIQGLLYEVVRPYHINDRGLAGRWDSLVVFEGYRFNIDAIQWENITKEADSALDKEPEGEEEGYFDGPNYFLAFNSKIRYSNKSDGVLSHFTTYLKDSVLNRWLAKKLPPMVKDI
jgi:hypothetical protein